MLKVRFVAVLLLALAVPLLVTAQQNKVPGNPGSAASAKASRGKEIFLEYCASCHGQLGRGDGPVAKALRSPPTDLTTLTARNKGQFPEMRVMGAIKAGPAIPAHGSEAMPVWGPIFMEVENSAREREAQLMVYNLMEYIKTLQAK